MTCFSSDRTISSCNKDLCKLKKISLIWTGYLTLHTDEVSLLQGRYIIT